MNGVQLDVTRLLGFKIVVSGQNVRTAKIGGKPDITERAVAVSTAKIGAKIGVKAG
ncbi:hypothetical protein [Dongia deserti]|uniref:hypothetical protein n=1 Tax=Dongia deserti TaxID=2268030 RepID=UPI0013C480FB|nr:hypothetical protein [Dongia deserti]